MRKIKGSITSPKGFTASAVAADIKEIGKTREDLCVLYSEKPCVAAGVFTKNTLKSGTVLLCHKTLENPTHQGVVATAEKVAGTFTHVFHLLSFCFYQKPEYPADLLP